MEKQIQEQNIKIGQMREHLKNVQSELSSTQTFNTSKLKEVETERHLKQVAERETGRLKGDSEKLKKDEEEIQAKVSLLPEHGI